MKTEHRPIWAVVPVKHFEKAKSRLAGVLSAAERAAFARALFEHVVGTLEASGAVSGILVVTDSAEVTEAATRRGCVVRSDPDGARTLADCVDRAIDEVRRLGARSAVVVVSDLPDVTARDIGDLVAGLETFDVVLAPDKQGDHTNALAVRTESAFATSFGSADSLRRHRQSAERAGLSVFVLESPTLAFDVDTPEDYERSRPRR